MRNKTPIVLLTLFLSLLSLEIMAEEKEPVTIATLQYSLDIVWIVLAGALVFFMQAGFALLEGGMVRSKNAVNVIMKNYTDMCFGALAFWLVGYGLMFGSNSTGWYGADHFFVNTADGKELAIIFFQMMFAATAATIVSGALAERVRFSAYVVVSIFVTAFIYTIYGSWAWGSLFEGTGWLRELGFIDFAGSTVVHSVGGWCALAGVIVLGPRLGRFGPTGEVRNIAGHNLPFVALGGFILWLGWFGFNGGSTLEANSSIGLVIINTQLSATAGVVGAVLSMVVRKKPVLLTNTINGGLAGLVGVTAGCATMEPMFAIITGLVAGVIVSYGQEFMEARGWDDPVGAVSVHGLCGAWGTLAAGMFQVGGLFNIDQMIIQLTGIVTAFVWAFGTSFIVFKVVDLSMGLCADTVAQQRGLDYVEHYEVGYPEFQQNTLFDNKG